MEEGVRAQEAADTISKPALQENIADPAEHIRSAFLLPSPDVKTYSALSLAYLGDAVYELVIRTVILSNGNSPVNRLHKHAVHFVCAEKQAELITAIMDQLSEEELKVYKRGRNAKSFTKAKNAATGDYRKATGLEALVGYLYLEQRFDRLLELIRKGLEITEEREFNNDAK